MYGYYHDQRNILPSTYLSYARKDQENNEEERCRINAVGNAKRAFHLQTEKLCDAFGWRAGSKKKNPNFGTLLDYLAKCGVLSPNILRKLNSTRNKVEHDYFIPEPGQVEDYIDVVELFLMATRELLDKFPEHIEYELLKDDQYDQSLDLPDSIYIKIKMIEGGITLHAGDEKITMKPSDPDYYSWLSEIVRHYML